MLNTLKVNSINKAAFMSTYIIGHLQQTCIIRKHRLYDSSLSFTCHNYCTISIILTLSVVTSRYLFTYIISLVLFIEAVGWLEKKMNGLRGLFSFILVVFAGSLIWNVNAGIIYKAIITNGTGKYIIFKDLIILFAFIRL